MKLSRKTLAAVLVITLLCTVSWALATTMTIKFKDGTVVNYDATKIESVIFSETATPGAQEGTAIFEDTFPSGLSDTWEPIACAGGSFDKFAKALPGRIEVIVPEGNSWGKTGIVSRQPLFTVGPDMETAPLALELKFDPARTTGLIIGLSESKTQDLYWAQNVWFHIGRPSVTATSSDFSNTQNGVENYGSAKGPAAFPGTVTLTIKPGFVSVETSTGIKQEGKFSWLKPGSSAYLYIFSHPTAEGLPAAFILEKIRMFTGR
ncbi:MAG: hypothetical protein V2A78_04040 [bacterium]